MNLWKESETGGIWGLVVVVVARACDWSYHRPRCHQQREPNASRPCILGVSEGDMWCLNRRETKAPCPLTLTLPHSLTLTPASALTITLTFSNREVH